MMHVSAHFESEAFAFWRSGFLFLYCMHETIRTSFQCARYCGRDVYQSGAEDEYHLQPEDTLMQ
jgi:hypothetical protein